MTSCLCIKESFACLVSSSNGTKDGGNNLHAHSCSNINTLFGLLLNVNLAIISLDHLVYTGLLMLFIHKECPFHSFSDGLWGSRTGREFTSRRLGKL